MRLNPETLSAVIVVAAGLLTILLGWRLWQQIRSPITTYRSTQAWEPSGNEEVWIVYNRWREAQLSIKYLESRIARLITASRWVDGIIAVSTASSVGSQA